MLDWTYDPRIAAYFAARGAMSHRQDFAPPIKDADRPYASRSGRDGNEGRFDSDQDASNEKMAVWAFNRMFDGLLRFRDQLASLGQPIPYDTVTIPYVANPNIQAQQGAFTVVIHRYDANRVDRAPLDEMLYAYLKRHSPGTLETSNPESTIPLFFKFELPWSEHGSLLRQLANAGVNASSVFPGYSGVVDGVREKLWCWERYLTD